LESRSDERIGAGPAFLAWAGAAFIRMLRATVRMRFHGDASVRAFERGGRHFILAFWHRHLLLMRYAYRGPKMSVLVSRSRDGELIARVMERLGIATSRGSTSRGGAAGLRDLLRRARGGWDLAVTPDGPRGPLREVQPGIVLAAAASGLPVIPVAIAASRRRELGSWDRMVLPLPGSRVHVVYGEPIEVPRDARPGEWCPLLKNAIDAVEAEAEARARRASPAEASK
jgi:lysophospholipid acyltransferase (LPLAT)-like uncharacterized protein